jgi:hypothetical protein
MKINRMLQSEGGSNKKLKIKLNESMKSTSQIRIIKNSES